MCQLIPSISQQLRRQLFAARRFVLRQREITTADDKDYVHFFVRQILGALKKGNLSNHLLHLDHSWPHLTLARLPHLAVFINTGDLQWQSKQQRYSTVISIVYNGRSWFIIIPCALRALGINPIATYTSVCNYTYVCAIYRGIDCQYRRTLQDRGTHFAL